MPTVPSLVARRTDDPHHFGDVVAEIRDAVWDRAAVVDAVARLELALLVAALELDRAANDDEELLGVAVRVLLRSGRALGGELADEDLEVMERVRAKNQLPPENPDRETRAVVAPQHPRSRGLGGLKEVGDHNAECV